jgi:hypothetical protein
MRGVQFPRISHFCCRFSLLTLLVACGGRDQAAAPPAIVFHSTASEPDFGAIDVAPLDAGALAGLRRAKPTLEQWQALFPVHAGDTTGLAMLGAYTIEDRGLRFTPRFAPSPGNRYSARFDAEVFNRMTGARLPAGGAHGTWTLVQESGPGTTVVDALYPSSDSVPMNLLRIYVQFSAPMSVGESGERLRVLDESGRAVKDAFLIPSGGEELWDPEKRRLTVLFDPGRIKRDLKPHEERGLPLQAGHTYRIVIDSAWRDATGHPLARAFERTLRVRALDRTSPRTTDWHVIVPGARSRDALVLHFPEPLDRALLSRLLVVKRADGAAVDGMIDVRAHETEWRFTPATAWSAGAHYIEVNTDLEDLAGNSLKRLFDVMPGDSAVRGVRGASVRVAFSPRD